MITSLQQMFYRAIPTMFAWASKTTFKFNQYDALILHNAFIKMDMFLWKNLCIGNTLSSKKHY